MKLDQIVSLTNAVNRAVPVPIHLPNGTGDWFAAAARPSRGKFAAMAAGSAAAAGAFALYRYWASHHALTILESDPYELCLLHDLHDDDDAMRLIQAALFEEWGPYGPADLAAMKRMAKNAGHRIFVLQIRDGDGYEPVGVLQTGLADVHGDPHALVDKFPSFAAITADGGWNGVDKMKGDTALLLQITAFGERSHGVGSMLRDAALYSLPSHVKYALTTTPVAEAFDLDGAPEVLPPAVRFHYRGGARPAAYQPGYKLVDHGAANAEAGRQHNENVVFMRYRRLENGDWEGVPASSFHPRGKEKADLAPALAPA